MKAAVSISAGTRRTGRAALLLAIVAVPAVAPLGPDEPALELAVERVALDPAEPGRETVGRLRYLGGLWLRSEDPRFGGLSDLLVSPDGSRLMALSDCGRGLTATLEYDGRGRLTGLRGAGLVRLLAPSGQAVSRREQDAESLTHDGVGLLVGFEGQPRLWRYMDDPPFAGVPEARPVPKGTVGCESNRGLEGAATLEDGRILLISEGRDGQPRTAPAWLGSGEEWTSLDYPLTYGPDSTEEPFRPTGAACLPGGDVVVVERRFPPLAVRIVRIPRPGRGVAALAPVEELARLAPPLAVDNFEGVAVRLGPAGETLLYLLSDDNDCAKHPGATKKHAQRTLLLMFALAP
jgi:hypothetical protein